MRLLLHHFQSTARDPFLYPDNDKHSQDDHFCVAMRTTLQGQERNQSLVLKSFSKFKALRMVLCCKCGHRVTTALVRPVATLIHEHIRTQDLVNGVTCAPVVPNEVDTLNRNVNDGEPTSAPKSQ